MAVEVETKDCTALTDAEIEEMADMAAASPARLDIGILSKGKEDWVLITRARVDGKLHAFSFATLERIGGTPCVLLGLASIKRTSKRNSVMSALMAEEYHRALMAFPDEDVLIGTRISSASGFEVFKACDEVLPRPGHRAVGEERAWGRRLVKRFGVEGAYDEQSFVVKGKGPAAHFDHESTKPDAIPADIQGLFKGIKPEKGDCLIAHGWVMAENLLKLGSR
jgi:hypothetical protein